MPADTPLTDDYVADLLAKDARASSIRYSTMGMGALLPSRPTGAARKPNTRFLRNILKETDTHNAALLAREAKARLRKLRGERETKGKPEQMRYDVRSRFERGAERQGKRRRVDEDERDDRDKRHRSEDTKSHGSRTETPRREGKARSGDSGKRRRTESDGEDEDERRARHRQHLSSRKRWHGSRSRGRSRSPSTEDRRTRQSSPHRSQHHSHRRRRQSYSPPPSRSASPVPSRSHHHHHHHHRRRHKSRRRHRHRSPSSSSTNPTKPTSARDRAPSPPTSTRSTSSDPLSPLLGPLPAPKVQARGRGAFTGSSGAIDAHFAASYDPGTDVSLGLDDPDAGDWDLALEALRDRQRWKAQGAHRLRAAGFGEDEVRKWEARTGTADGERERDEKDVKWKGRGEGREWDRGKVLGEDGVELRAEWGRLKGM